MNIRRNYFAGLISLLVLMILFTSIELYPQKNKYGRYPGDKPIPNFHEFPPAIQRYDSIKVLYFKDMEEQKKRGKEFDYSEKFIEDFASAFISSYMFYSNVDGSGLKDNYFNIANPMGIKMGSKLGTLPYPWEFLLDRAGVVLVSILNDTILPKKEVSYPDPFRDLNHFVLKAKVIDDFFNSIEEDTILVRHIYSISDEEIFKYGNNVQLLFALSNKSTVQRGENFEYIYAMGAKYKKEKQYIFVVDGIVQDPYNVLGITGKSYYQFKKEFINLCHEKGIRP